MEVEEAVKKCKKMCEYDGNFLVLDDKVLQECQEAIETVLKELENRIPRDIRLNTLQEIYYSLEDR